MAEGPPQVFPEDEFVFRIVRDPADPPDTILVIGFIGRAAIEDHCRVYLDVMLSAYVDLPTSSILHVQALSRAQSPLGGSYVWVRRDSDLMESVQEAYQRLTQVQQEYVSSLTQPNFGGFGDLQPGWPLSPTS